MRRGEWGLAVIAGLALLVYAAIVAPPLTAQIAAGTINAKQTGTWTVQPGNTANTTAWLTTGTGGTFPSTQSGTWTVQPGNTANTTAWLVTGTGGTFPATQSGTWTVQPGNTANTTAWLVNNVGTAGFTSLVTGQLAVTGTAQQLAANAGKRVCLKVLTAGTQTVYFGPTGVTTSNGQELSAGDAWCGPIDNSNRIFVIAAATGSTVAFDVLNN